MRCAEWISKLDGQTVGVAEREDGAFWGIASQDEGWELARVLKGSAEEIVREALRKQLMKNGGAGLVLRTAGTIPRLSSWLDLRPWEVADRVKGEVAALSQATGRRLGGAWEWAADDAYDALVTEKTFRDENPVPYTNICLQGALSGFSEPLDSSEPGIGWRAGYQDLFVRVLAHYTREPVLLLGLEDGDPMPRLSESLGMEHPYGVLVWSAFYWDTGFIRTRYPHLLKDLPDDLQEMQRTVDAKLPVLSLQLARIREGYVRNRGLATLWGRRSGWKGSAEEELGEVFHHHLAGSCEDIVTAACVSMRGTLGPRVMVEDPEFSPLDRHIVLKGRVAAEDECYAVLERSARLDNPLGVALDPDIVIGD